MTELYNVDKFWNKPEINIIGKYQSYINLINTENNEP